MKKGLLLLSVVGLWIACSETHIDEPTLAPDRPATKADTTRNWTGYMSYKDGTGQIANWNAVPASGGTFSLFVSTPYYYPNGQSTPVYANEGYDRALRGARYGRKRQLSPRIRLRRSGQRYPTREALSRHFSSIPMKRAATGKDVSSPRTKG